MSKDKLRSEINKVLEKFSDKALEELYSYLKKLQNSDGSLLSNPKDLKRILSEDKQLLQKLAR